MVWLRARSFVWLQMSEADGMQASEAKLEPVFKNLSAEDPDQEATEIESLCVNCGENVIIYGE